MDKRLLLGLLVGGVWNAANLWCLTRLLLAWLGPRPSVPRALLWVGIKFPLLYLAAFALLRLPVVSLLGFALGFTLVLALAIGWVAVHHGLLPRSVYGR